MTTVEFLETLPAEPRSASAQRSDERPRRIFNLMVAGIALLITAPLMVSIAVLIKLTSPGPVLYVQPRIGLDRRTPRERNGNSRRRVNYGGRPFKIYKFRTMITSPANSTTESWASPDDPRVTPVGRVLRKFRLDELPQFFNVLRGDMNIVGPRPEQPRIFQDLRAQIERYEERQQVHPGITGLAQISQHYDSSIEDVRRKVRFDLEYVARRSLAVDLQIMVRTVPVVLLKRGAW